MSVPHGWLSDQEARELQSLAAGKTVLELGAWKGRSTVALAAVAEYVVSVDRHQGIVEMGDEDSLPDYLDAVRGLGNVAIVVADFDRMVPLLADFDVVYVDGNHDDVSAERDARMALMHLSDGGVVAFHDWDIETVREGVTRAYRRTPDRVQGSIAQYRW